MTSRVCLGQGQQLKSRRANKSHISLTEVLSVWEAGVCMLGVEEQGVTKSQREASRGSDGFQDVKGVVMSEAAV